MTPCDLSAIRESFKAYRTENLIEPYWIFIAQFPALIAEVEELRKQCDMTMTEREAELFEEVADLRVETEALRAKLEKAKGALREIQLGQGEFSHDLLQHADNTIVNLRRLANEALAELEAP